VTLVFLDSETRSLADLKAVGAYKYARDPSTDVLVWTWAFDNEPAHVWSPWWCWGSDDQAPAALLDLFDHVADGGYLIAWNAFFDRHIWNEVMTRRDYQWPRTRPEQWLCAQAQAEANNLPGKLEKACEALGLPAKDRAGKGLIAELSHGTREDWNPANHAKLGRFRAYGAKDTEVMRNVWNSTRPLTLDEWAEYHASERINDRGVAVDHDFARAAMRYANAENADLNRQLFELTGIENLTVTNHVLKAKWLRDQLWPSPELQALVIRPPREKNGVETARQSADRSTREAVATALANPDFAQLFDDVHLSRIVTFLGILEAGNSAAVRKFTAIANQVCSDGRVHGSYSFNGAGQTGRFCVDAATLIETARGPIRIDQIAVGDFVLTHCGRYRPVVSKCTKGVEAMYRIEFAHGGHVTCTAGHRIWHDGEWRHVSELESFARQNVSASGSRSIPEAIRDDRPNCAALANELRNDSPHHRGGCRRSNAQETSWSESLALETRYTQSDVWFAESGWSNSSRKISGVVGSRNAAVRVRASPRIDERTQTETLAGWLGDSPHQRRSNRQSPRQLRVGDEARASIVARPEITWVVSVGERTVWDICVSGDHSYVSEGVAHHNSSRGVQIHNLIRAPLDADDPDRAMDAIEDILAGASAESLEDVYELPMSRLLARLIRPTFIAPEGKVLVWGDWDQIEARVLPWLADSPGAEAKLELFRTGAPVYKIMAAGILGKAVEEITAHERQAYGKVPELALGFGGSVGAFAAMGRNYGVALPEEQVRAIVDGWRRVNSWARDFWDALWGAFVGAWQHPGEWFRAGRVRYLFHPALMRGTMICALPCGRWIVYPQLKRERYETEDGITRIRTTFVKGFSAGIARVELWYGTLCIARGTEVLTSRGWIPIESVAAADRVWDGENWVVHSGVVRNGKRGTIDVYGVLMTPDHLVLTHEGWNTASEAQRRGLKRQNVRLPDGVNATPASAATRFVLGLSLRVREISYRGGRRFKTAFRSFLRLQGAHSVSGGTSYPRTDAAPVVLGVALHESSMHEPTTSSVEELRRSRDFGLSPMVAFREFLARHASHLRKRTHPRSSEQQRQLHTEELPLGDSYRTGEQQTAEVYDILNCGPLHQFVVRGRDGQPLIVHNCENVTQATSASFLRRALSQLSDSCILHVHDEIVLEVAEADEYLWRERLKENMLFLPEWAAGLPLSATIDAGPYYTK